MADPDKTASAPIADPFAGAKASLRDTIKWLATTFSAVIGVVIAGTSLAGISKLTGVNMVFALAGGVIGLLCIVAATGVMLRLLVPQSFYFGDLVDPENTELLSHLDTHAVELLPPEITDIETFVARRNEAVLKIRNNAAKPDSDAYKEGRAFLDDIQESMANLTYFAHYEKLRGNLHRAEPTLFALALGAILGLGTFAVFTGTAKPPPEPSPKPSVTNTSIDAQRPPAGHPAPSSPNP